MLAVHDAVYRWMRRLAPEYSGGYWHFYELSNGGFYMAPECEPLLLRVEGNGYEGVMSSAAAGITACPFGFSHLSFGIADEVSARTTTSSAISPWSIGRRAPSSQPSTDRASECDLSPGSVTRAGLSCS
jgi:Antirestriction protein